MERTKKLLSGIDIYGAEFQFYVNKSSSIKTSMGGIFTLLTLGFFVFTFVVFGYDFYYKLNPNVIFQQKIYTDEEIYKMNNMTIEDTPVVMKMRKRMAQEMYFIVDANVPFTFQEVKNYSYVKNCTNDYVLRNFYPNSYENGMEDLNGDWAFLCYDTGQFPFGLHDAAGGQGSDVVNVLSIWTTNCGKKNWRGMDLPCPPGVNFSTPWNMRSDMEIWTKQILFNPDELKTPFNSTWTRIASLKLSMIADIEVYLYLLETVAMDDAGFLLESLKRTSKFGLGKVETLNFIRDSPRTSFDFTLYIGFDKTFNQYMRRYMRIQDLLAVVGGILKALTSFFTIVAFPLNEHHLIDYIKDKVERNNYFTVKSDNPIEMKILNNNILKRNEGRNDDEIRQVNKRDKKIDISKNSSQSDMSINKSIHSQQNLNQNRLNQLNENQNQNQNEINRPTNNNVQTLNNNFSQSNMQPRINNFMNSSSFNLKNYSNFKILKFGTYDYFKSTIGCGDKSLERTFDYLNSLRSIEYIMNSYTELTFLKSTELSNIQHLALQILPIYPEELVEFNDNSIEKVSKYLKDNEAIKQEGRNVDKFDYFLTSKFIPNES